jgi:hypothetical protein
MKLSIPGQNHRPFPMNAKLPFTVTVSTFSIPVYATSDPETDKDALCPSIDTAALHLLLRLKLKRYTTIRVRGALSTRQQAIGSYHALPNFQQKDTLDVDVGPKEWVAYTGDDQKLNGKGHWKQQFIFRSSIVLSSQLATPTFKHTLIDVSVRIMLFSCNISVATADLLCEQYALRLECTIPSRRRLVPDHCITIKLPIVISSGTNSTCSTRPSPSRVLFVLHYLLRLAATDFIQQS